MQHLVRTTCNIGLEQHAFSPQAQKLISQKLTVAFFWWNICTFKSNLLCPRIPTKPLHSRQSKPVGNIQ